MPRCTSCNTVLPSAGLRKRPSGPRCKEVGRCEQRREKAQLPLFEEAKR